MRLVKRPLSCERMNGYRTVLGIDPAARNFAWCLLYDDRLSDPFWNRESILSGDITKDGVFRATLKWCESHRDILEIADAIVIEQQMQDICIIISTVIRTLYPHKTRELAPATVSAVFGLPRRRADKKKAAIRLVEQFAKFPLRERKLDDLADAYLCAAYDCLEFNESSREVWKHVAPLQSTTRAPWGDASRTNKTGGDARPSKRRADKIPVAIDLTKGSETSE